MAGCCQFLAKPSIRESYRIGSKKYIPDSRLYIKIPPTERLLFLSSMVVKEDVTGCEQDTNLTVLRQVAGHA